MGANVALSACLCALVMQSSGSVTLGCAVAAGTGLLVGLGNGTMVTLLRIPPFIATYGMLWIVHGLTYWIMNGESIHGFAPAVRALGSGYVMALLFFPDLTPPPGQYLAEIADWLNWMDFVLILVKTVAFGFIIAVVTCYHGLAQPLRQEQVSGVAVRAVTQGIVACTLLDLIFIIVYLANGLV